MSENENENTAQDTEQSSPVSEAPPADETTDTNAGEDAVQGTIAEAEPTDTGDQKPMNEGLTDG